MRIVTALVLGLLVVSGAGTETRAQHSRKTPIVEAMAKTKASIITIAVPRPGRKDAVGTGIVVVSAATLSPTVMS
jgi:hypothetical protein